MTDVILGLLILGPVVLTFLLKSNAALGFLALCLGFVLSTSVIGDLKELLNQMELSVTDSTLALVLLLAPFILTLLVGRGAHKRGLMFVLQLLAAIGAGGLLALSVAPILATSTSLNLSGSQLWDGLQEIQAAVIGTGALVSLIVIWFGGFKLPGKKKH